MERVELNKIVDLVVVNVPPELDFHPFHVHGHHFRVLAQGHVTSYYVILFFIFGEYQLSMC